jgi:hypothetical protein
MKQASPIVAPNAFNEHKRTEIIIFRDSNLPTNLKGLNSLNVLKTLTPGNGCSGAMIKRTLVRIPEATTTKSRTFHAS